MDEFGVLVESIGFKADGKSAPMAHLKSKPKPKPKPNFSFTSSFPQNRGVSSANAPTSSLYNDSFVNDLDGIFQPKKNISENFLQKSNFDDNDIFGAFSNSKPSFAQAGSIDLDSVLNFNNSDSKSNPSLDNDLLSSMPSGAVDDLLRNFGLNLESLKNDGGGTGSQFDDLIPGFSGSSPPSKEVKSETNLNQPSSDHSFKSSSSLVADPFSLFESSTPATNDSSWPFSDPLVQDTGKCSVQSSIDELENFARSKVRNDARNKQSATTLGNIKLPFRKDNANVRKVKAQDDVLLQKPGEKDKGRAQKVAEEKKELQLNESNLDDIFRMDTQPINVNRQTSKTKDPVFDALFNDQGGSEVRQTRSMISSNKSSPATIFSDDFSLLFGEEKSGEFLEIEGESEERRKARLKQHMRTQKRMAEALAEKNQRDLQNHYEQEERHRLAETLDNKIKRWAAGKEGNLRALLSSLQDVLWPECGWQQVSLTDLITSVSVKKVYQKANLFVHPDKVQQKGANVEQKYTAEKVFDLLKEAWTKFNAEELR